MKDEWFPLVDEDGAVIGRVQRREAHGNPALLHPVVHCLVLDQAGRLLLQRRSLLKDVQPGRWDTSVGGHVGEGETIEAALQREVEEELGTPLPLSEATFLYRYIMRSAIESELVHTYLWRHEGPFIPQPEEIDELRFWSREEIVAAQDTGVFTPNFLEEFQRLLQVLATEKGQ